MDEKMSRLKNQGIAWVLPEAFKQEMKNTTFSLSKKTIQWQKNKDSHSIMTYEYI